MKGNWFGTAQSESDWLLFRFQLKINENWSGTAQDRISFSSAVKNNCFFSFCGQGFQVCYETQWFFCFFRSRISVLLWKTMVFLVFLVKDFSFTVKNNGFFGFYGFLDHFSIRIHLAIPESGWMLLTWIGGDWFCYEKQWFFWFF